MKNSIQIIKTQTLFKGNFSCLNSKTYIASDGSERNWEFFHKKDIVVILAKTKEQRYVLINNFRIPIESTIIECPAGLLDNNSSKKEQAKKELLEETGYSSNNFVELGNFKINPGITDNSVTYFFADEATIVSEKNLEVSEQNEVVLLTEQELFNQLTEGKNIDINIFSLIYLSKLNTA